MIPTLRPIFRHLEGTDESVRISVASAREGNSGSPSRWSATSHTLFASSTSITSSCPFRLGSRRSKQCEEDANATDPTRRVSRHSPRRCRQRCLGAPRLVGPEREDEGFCNRL